MAPAPSLVVLDTSVVSLLMRSKGESSYYRRELEGLRAVISFQTLEESWFGAIKNSWGDRNMNKLMGALDQFDIVWPTPEIAQISANLRNDRERAGRRLETADAWIAATAIMLDCPLASHDGDFDEIPGLQLIRDSSRTP